MPNLGDRLASIADAAAARLVAVLTPAGPDAVSRDWIVEQELDLLTGRKYFVLPAGARVAEPATRGADLKEFRLRVLVLERCPDPGRPTREWIDQFVGAVGAAAAALVTARDPSLWLLGTFYSFPQDVEIAGAVDEGLLLSDKLGWAEVEAKFQGIEP